MTTGRAIVWLVVLGVVAACGSSGEGAGRDPGGGADLDGGGHSSEAADDDDSGSMGADASVDASGSVFAFDAGADGEAGGDADAGESGGSAPTLDGCWVTHTDSGETTLQISVAAPSADTETDSAATYRMTNVSYDGSDFQYDVDFSAEGGSPCHIDFTVVSTSFMSGVSDCAGNDQTVVADRTCL